MPIPWTAASEYADRADIDDFYRFWSLIRRMDAAFVEHLNAKKPKTTPKPSKR